MWKFIKQILAVFIALILFFVFMIFLLVGIGSAASQADKVVMTEDNSILKFTFDKPILEKEVENPFAELGLPMASDKGGDGLIEIKRAILNAKKDPKIKGIYINASSLQAGSAMVEEIRSALLDFKTSKKFIYAYSETYSESAYYLASVADRIFLNPVGLMELNGMSSQHLFLKGTLDKLEIQPQIFRVGTYKSAIEPLILDKMSDANRKQTLSFINSMNDYHMSQVSKSRNIPLKRMQTIQDSMLVHNPQDALRLKVVTDLGYYDQVISALKIKLGIEQSEKLNFISYGRYKNSEVEEDENKSTNRIAVIVAEGDISSGKSTDGTIGSDDMADEIRKARLDDKVKAIVLRINSPGGSALASDIMWREVVLAKKVKPVIASMSDVAASGGYYLAMGCSKIVAQPNSITGSIGVFGVLFNIKNFLKNKLGVSVDGVKTGLFSDVGTATREATPYEKKVIQNEVEMIYMDFVTKAAEGRKMSYDSLESLASGRVWSGIEAKQNGLVDELGGMDKAIAIAAKSAKLGKDYNVDYYPIEKSFFEKILSDFQTDTKMRMMKAELGDYFGIYSQVSKLKRYQGIQARLPFEIVLN
jgi:protease-4